MISWPEKFRHQAGTRKLNPSRLKFKNIPGMLHNNTRTLYKIKNPRKLSAKIFRLRKIYIFLKGDYHGYETGY